MPTHIHRYVLPKTKTSFWSLIHICTWFYSYFWRQKRNFWCVSLSHKPKTESGNVVNVMGVITAPLPPPDLVSWSNPHPGNLAPRANISKHPYPTTNSTYMWRNTVGLPIMLKIFLVNYLTGSGRISTHIPPSPGTKTGEDCRWVMYFWNSDITAAAPYLIQRQRIKERGGHAP